MNSSTVNYETLQLEDIKKDPDGLWDFEKLHRAQNFDISWVEEFPDKNWDFFDMTTACYYKFLWEWFEKFPDKPWNYEEMHLHVNLDNIKQFPDKPWDYSTLPLSTAFDISWVEEFPDKPWCFYLMSGSDNLDISWIDKYPDEDWRFEILHLNFDFKLEWVEKYPNRPWNFQEILEFKIKGMGYLTDEQVEKMKTLCECDCNIQMYFVVRKYIPDLKVYNLFDGVFNQIDSPLELQDVGGNTYQLTDWFDQDDILAYAKETFPELGEFDISIESQDGKEELLMASKTDVKTFKTHLFQNPQGPQGMIVYQ